MAKKTGYAVLAQNFSYDDCFHHPDDTGSAVSVFFDKKEAAAEVLRLTAERIKGERLGRFCEQLSTLTSLEPEEFSEKFYAILGTQPEENTEDSCLHDEYEVPEKISDVDALRIAKLLDEVQFYFVEKIDVYEPGEHPFIKAAKSAKKK